jgi:DNA-binding IclR family transcriptional regulator
VFDGPGLVAAVVSVSGPIDRLGQQPGRRLSAAVTSAAAALTATLRGSGNPPHVTAG